MTHQFGIFPSQTLMNSHYLLPPATQPSIPGTLEYSTQGSTVVYYLVPSETQPSTTGTWEYFTQGNNGVHTMLKG